MKNEWDLLLTARRHADAGAAQATFRLLGPARWTIFSGRPAWVRGADDTTYALGADFPAVLHECVRAHLDTHLVWERHPPRYELSFRPGRHHPRFDPSQTAESPTQPPAGQVLTSGSPQALRAFLDNLPPDDDAPGSAPPL